MDYDDAAVQIDRRVPVARFQGVKQGMHGRGLAFSSVCGTSWWNSTSETQSIIRRVSAQVYGD